MSLHVPVLCFSSVSRTCLSLHCNAAITPLGEFPLFRHPQLQWDPNRSARILGRQSAAALEFHAGAELTMFVDDGDQELEIDAPTDLRPLLKALVEMMPS